MTDTLHSRWVMWYHGRHNNNWGKDSYALLGVAATVSDVDSMYHYFNRTPSSHTSWADAMLFWMRERSDSDGHHAFIYPTWEDTHNSGGGAICLSSSDHATLWHIFWDMVAHVSGESFCTDPRTGYDLVNGVSINRKRDHTYLKVWYRELPRRPVGKQGNDAAHITSGWCDRMRQHALSYKAYVVMYHRVKEKDTETMAKRSLQNDGGGRRRTHSARRRSAHNRRHGRTWSRSSKRGRGETATKTKQD